MPALLREHLTKSSHAEAYPFQREKKKTFHIIKCAEKEDQDKEIPI